MFCAPADIVGLPVRSVMAWARRAGRRIASRSNAITSEMGLGGAGTQSGLPGYPLVFQTATTTGLARSIRAISRGECVASQRSRRR